jgi:branched-chain amino acid transport system ATP-binding protein
VSAPMLELRGVHAYYGRAHILADVGLTVAPGEVVVLAGRNGAGKSTTLKTIMGLVRAAAGEIVFAGRRVERCEPFEVARLGIGYVPEDRRIFAGLSVAENLEVGRQPARAGAPQWTPEVLFGLFPNLASVSDRPGGRISGGEQQMLAIARALMGNPRCLLLDEPSEGLAPLIVESLAAAIRELKLQGVAVLLSEQNVRFAERVGDRACVIEQGRVRFSGTMPELARDEAAKSAYLGV